MCLGSGRVKGLQCRWPVANEGLSLGISTEISKQAHETRVKPSRLCSVHWLWSFFLTLSTDALSEGHITVWQLPMVGPWLGFQPTPPFHGLPEAGIGAPWAAGRQRAEAAVSVFFSVPSCHAHSLPDPNTAFPAPLKRFHGMKVSRRQLNSLWLACLFSHEG